MIKIKKNNFIKLVSMYFRKSIKNDTPGLTAEMSFYLLTALFPFFILLFVIATLISDNMQKLLLNVITLLPRDMENMIISLLESFSRSLPIIITSSVLGLWYMSNVISTLTKALNRFYGVKESRGFFKLRGMFFMFAIFVIILVILSFALIIFGEGTRFWLEYTNYLPFLNAETVWNYTRYGAIVLVVFITILMVFKHLPNKKLSVKAVAAGSALTTVAWCITSYLFSFYVNSFSKYHVIYGSLTSIIILITWIYLSAYVILLGGSINAFWYRLNVAKKLNNARKIARDEI